MSVKLAGILAAQDANSSVRRDVKDAAASHQHLRLAIITKVFNDDDGNSIRVNVTFLDKNEFGKEEVANGLELLYFGSHLDGSRWNVAVNDYVLVIATKRPVIELTDTLKPSVVPKSFQFGTATMKAIPIQPSVIAAEHIGTAVVDGSRSVTINTPLSIIMPESTGVTLTVDKTVATIADDNSVSLAVNKDKCTVSIADSGAVSLVVGGSKCKIDIAADGAVAIESSGEMKVKASKITMNDGALVVSGQASSE